MKKAFLGKIVVIMVILFALSLLIGCAGMEKAPANRLPGYAYYPKALVHADNALNEARQAGKDKECPAEFNESKAMVDKAYEVYMSCRTKEAIEMAKNATAKAKALCPAAPMPAPKMESKPEPKPAKVIDRMTLRVLFGFNKSEVTERDKAELNKAIVFIKKYPGTKIKLEGHTDSVGTKQYNQALSERRALAVKEYLVKGGGIDKARITTAGYGESQPIATNKTKEGRAENRRVEVLILGQ
ncbi:MAG: OmpA family protein [Dissulfurispiraceae bacterium]